MSVNSLWSIRFAQPFSSGTPAYYEAHRLHLLLALSHVDAANSVSAAVWVDAFDDQHTQMNLTSTYQVKRYLAVYSNAYNLNNSPRFWFKF